MQAVANELGDATFYFHAGISYRNLLVWKKGRGRDVQLTPPHDISSQPITNYLPAGTDGSALLDLIKKSQLILRDHPVNRQRKNSGHPPATSIWLWGEGFRPALPTFEEL